MCMRDTVPRHSIAPGATCRQLRAMVPTRWLRAWTSAPYSPVAAPCVCTRDSGIRGLNPRTRVTMEKWAEDSALEPRNNSLDVVRQMPDALRRRVVYNMYRDTIQGNSMLKVGRGFFVCFYAAVGINGSRGPMGGGALCAGWLGAQPHAGNRLRVDLDLLALRAVRLGVVRRRRRRPAKMRPGLRLTSATRARW